MKKNAFIFVALCLLSACGSKQKEVDEAGKPLVIDLHEAINNPVKQMLLSDVAEDIEIIPLETAEKSIFKRIRHLVSFNDGILLCTGSVVKFFNRQGKYIKDIGAEGQGPADYLFPSCVGYDEKKKEVFIPSPMTNEIKVYGIDGKFKRRIEFSRKSDFLSSNSNAREKRDYRFIDGYHIMRRMLPLPDVRKKPWQVLIRDSTGRIIAEFTDPITAQYKEEIDHEGGVDMSKVASLWSSFTPVMSFYKGNHNIIYEGNDTIYRMGKNKNRLFRRYLMKTNSNHFPSKELHTKNKSVDYFDQYVHPVDILESYNSIYIVAENKSFSYLCRFDKSNGDINSIHKEGEIVLSLTFQLPTLDVDTPEFTDDLTGGCSFFPKHTNDNEWIGVIPAERLLTEIDIEELEKKEVKLTHRKQQLINVLKNLKEDDNPVLMIVKLK